MNMLYPRFLLILSCLFLLCSCERTVEENLVYHPWEFSGRNFDSKDPELVKLQDIFYLGDFQDTSAQFNVMTNCPSNPVQSHYRFKGFVLTFLECSSLIIEANGMKIADGNDTIFNQHCTIDSSFSVIDSTYKWSYDEGANQVSIFNADTIVYLNDIYIHARYSSPEEFSFEMKLWEKDSSHSCLYYFC